MFEFVMLILAALLTLPRRMTSQAAQETRIGSTMAIGAPCRFLQMGIFSFIKRHRFQNRLVSYGVEMHLIADTQTQTRRWATHPKSAIEINKTEH